jgi:glutaryl-CoA dehydrogenase
MSKGVNGSKIWINNAPIADVFIIWARENNTVCGYILDKGMTGLTTQTIDGKMSLRTSITGGIFMDNVFVPKSNKLQYASGLSAPFSCLNSARFGIAFATPAVGEFCYELTRQYALERMQFNKPLAQNQLIQLKLADMVIEIALANQAALRLARLKDSGEDNPIITSMLKRNNVRKMLDVTRTCRDILGGNGISDDYHVIRHMLNLEAVNTYEGTADIHGLIVGKAITGLNAF